MASSGEEQRRVEERRENEGSWREGRAGRKVGEKKQMNAIKDAWRIPAR